MEEQFLEMVAEALEEDEVSMDANLEDLDGWDSLGALTLLSMIDDEYGVIIGNAELLEMVSINDMYTYVSDQMDS